MDVNGDRDKLSQQKQLLKDKNLLLGEEKGIQKYLYPRFTEQEVQKSENFVYFKTILFIGQTGAGKTTSINFFLNFILGVKYEDNFRFVLVNEKTVSGTQAVSQTQDVSIYYVKPINGHPALRIIDTPGLGDTRGLQQDKINTDKITQLFCKQIDTLTTICFVVKASDNRLVESFNLIIEAFLNMFGKDIVKIFVCLITHWDGIDEEPNAVQTLTFKGDELNKGCHISSLIDEIEEPWYFLLNNAPFTAKQKTKPGSRAWSDSIETFNDFFEQKVFNRTECSLQMTKEVLKHRKNMEYIIQNFNESLNNGLEQLQNIRNIYNCIQNMEQEMVASSNFTIQQGRYCTTKRNTRRFVTNCRRCEKTCSERSTCVFYRYNRRLKRRITTSCRCGCCLKDHYTSKYRYVSTYQTETVDSSYLRQKYYSLSSEKSQKEQILQGQQKDYLTFLAKLIYQLQEFMLSIKELNTKGIRPPAYESEETYLNSLIEEKKKLKQVQSAETIKILENLQICLKFIKNVPDYKFEGGTTVPEVLNFMNSFTLKVTEAFEKGFFKII